MKNVLIAAAAMVAFAGIGPAGAQGYGPTYGNTIHQSAGDRDARGTPKYYQPTRPYAYGRSYRPHRSVHVYPRSTTGAGGSGPYFDNSIHQSAGERDSRGTPKYYQGR